MCSWETSPQTEACCRADFCRAGGRSLRRARSSRHCPRSSCVGALGASVSVPALLSAVLRFRAPNDDAIALRAAVRPPFLGCASSAVRAYGRGALRLETVCLFPVLLPRRAPFAIIWRSSQAVNGKMNALGAPLTA